MITEYEKSYIDLIMSRRSLLKEFKSSNGVILYEGPSQIDGKPIVAIATGLNRSSENFKTGNMIQTWILRSDIPPNHAINLGEDESVCGNCPHRPASSKNPMGQGTCYVKVFQAPLNIWKKYNRGGYTRLTNVHYLLFKNKHLRIGSYGDPVAVPYELWNSLIKVTKSYTAYTHQWKKKKFSQFKNICMASVDTPSQAEKAINMGWRYFHIGSDINIMDKKRYEFLCPASKEAGQYLNCEQCGACSGGKSKANVFIVAHGAGWKINKIKKIAQLRQQKKNFSHLVGITVNRQKIEQKLKMQYQL